MILASTDFGLSYLLEVIGLVAFIFLVWKYVWSGGAQLKMRMKDRSAAIGAELAAGDEARRQSAELIAERKQALADAEGEAAGIVQQSKATAAELVAEGGRRAEEDYSRVVQRAEVQIEGSLARVRAEVVAEASEVIVRAVEAVIAAELDGTSHHRLIGEAIGATEAEAV